MSKNYITTSSDYVPRNNVSRNPNVLKIPGAPYVIRLDDSVPAVPISTLSSSNSARAPVYTNGYTADSIDNTRASRRNAGPKNQEVAVYNAPQDLAQSKAENLHRLKTNRGIIKLWLLSLITLGIYYIWFWHKFAKDLNKACEYDGKHTRGIIALFLLSIITLGIYAIVWKLKIVSRVDNGAAYYGQRSRTSVISYILWNTIGQIIFGRIIAEVKLFKTMNRICKGYNNSVFGDNEVIPQ